MTMSATDLSHKLKGMNFPAGKNDLLEKARDNGADDEVINGILGIPDREYNSMADVEHGLHQTE
ncbi:MAG: DUF2795 domain-containing protein [Alphaproteobacteria bacterium]|nr:DUF2795 domain-containing protein [Alphaproteobacteria bacterium]